MKDDNLETKDQPDRTVPVLTGFGLVVVAFIVRAVLASMPGAGPFEAWFLLVADVLFVTGAVYLLYLVGTYWWRRWRKQPKPYATPGMRSLLVILAGSSVVMPAAVFSAAALTGGEDLDGGGEVAAWWAKPTTAASTREGSAATVGPTAVLEATLTPEEDRLAFQAEFTEEAYKEEFNACWRAVGGDEGLHQRMGALEGLSVVPVDSEYEVTLDEGAASNVRNVFHYYSYTVEVGYRYAEVYEKVAVALEAQGLARGTGELEDAEYNLGILALHPFTDAEWLEVRDVAFGMLRASRVLFTTYAILAEMISPGCSAN